jgi:hypothetical protein
LGTSIATVDINTDLVENIGNYNKLNGCINKNFEKSMRQSVKQTLHNLVSKAALKYANEAWVLRSRDNEIFEAVQITFMRSLFGVTEREILRNVDMTSELGELILYKKQNITGRNGRNTHLGRHLQDIQCKHLFFIPTVVRDFGPTTQKVKRSILASEHVFQA